ncbi:hypothetical protein J7T55_007330 [Diaporthe amygdali]|uniref:uncharacterized protein n=1 Tax=Phomopsis amygdali TaxID=1214568 RepID=UPI0022FED31F|nr:uncharacterized protein J7T55_007330 [Diaporthe amygdali]KAJ0116351.1 hypothetical protein J7T55_007330 [Diaporthe amygdali]
MAPHPSNPRLPIWHTGDSSQNPTSAPRGDGDGNGSENQQTSHDFVLGDIGPSYQSTSNRSQSHPEPGLPNLQLHRQPGTNQLMLSHQHAIHGGGFATGTSSSHMASSRAQVTTGTPDVGINTGMDFDGSSQPNPPYTLPRPSISPPQRQTVAGKRKADTPERPSESTKAAKTGADQDAGWQSHGGLADKRLSSGGDSTESNKNPTSVGKPPEGKSSRPPGGGGGGGGDGDTTSDTEPRSTEKPLRSLPEIVMRLLKDARPNGLDLYTKSSRQFYIRVGTLCSGTDAPIHIMNLFAALKNCEGNQVFTTINCFGCEIEPFKQSFLMRNSKPELLFRDARDFAEGNAERARLVTGAIADIPSVDLFVAGTSCVDFSSLSSTKVRDFAGLAHALKEWKMLQEKHGTKLTRQHLSDDDWRAAIDAMLEQTERKNTSTKTFGAGMNYIKARQPMIVIFENVESAPWEKWVGIVFPLMGYAATVQKLDTKHFHLPQTRSRKYLIAFSHAAFTLQGAQTLCTLLDDEILQKLKHTHSNTVLDFLLPPNSLELHKARNEMELAAQAVRERETNWSFSKTRHSGYRRKKGIPDRRDWIRWDENSSSDAPANMWKPWENRQPCRVSDLLECVFTTGLYGKEDKDEKKVVHGQYDLRFKAQVIDCSQNVDRLGPTTVFGRTGCLTPNAIPVLTLEARPITGTESLRLQGLPVENFDMSVETQAQLQDLAGNAMTTTVVGAVILAALSAIARVAEQEGLSWLANMFHRGSFKINGKILNSFQGVNTNIDHGPQKLLHIKLYAYVVPRAQIAHNARIISEHHAITQGGVREILDLGERARRRCVCHHILAYSSIELHVCTVCGASFCKSCKGNPDHALVKSPESLEDFKSLPYSQAEYEFRKRFPPILWMRSETNSFVPKLDKALLKSTYSDAQRLELAKAIVEGLCHCTYQLQFVEITDAVRLEYTADSAFILRAVVEKAEIIWYLHLDEWSDAGKKLSGVLTTGQPIARAVLRPEEQNQFPGARVWEFWVPHKIYFPLKFEVQEQQSLCLTEVGSLGSMPTRSQRPIKELQGSVWTFHPECGFPEHALWVYDGYHQKLFLFKNIDPIGRAQEDVFVVSPVSRDMGHTPIPETRPVLMQFDVSDQIHRNFKNVLIDDGDFLIQSGKTLPIQGFVDGWWESLDKHGVRVEAFPNFGFEDVRALAKGAPTSIRRCDSPSAATDYNSCDKYQSLLTTSLPIIGKDEEAVKIQEVLKSLDLVQQLDLAEFARLIGPCYSAVEMGLVGTGNKVSMIQEDVALSSDCETCAPRIPEVHYVKAETSGGMGSRASGSVVARHSDPDQQHYEHGLQSKPTALRIDHNVTAEFNDCGMKKHGNRYVDIRFVANGHALLHQARAHLPHHPAHYGDTTETTGAFTMEFGVIENPRVVLPLANVSAPEPVACEDAIQPSGFQRGLSLFKEQSDSLQWMLAREEVEPTTHFVETEVAEVYHEKFHLRVRADAKRPVVRRGRVVADNVGFGKTAVCLGLIDVQNKTDRRDFLDMRRRNDHLNGLVHLHATLVIVPNQLTQQWVNEAKRFLSPRQYNIVKIEKFNELQKQGVAGLKRADIIICSNKVFQENVYHSELSRYCGSNGLDKIRTLQKVYRAWYKRLQAHLIQVRDDVVQILEQKNQNLARQQRRSLRRDLAQIRDHHQNRDGEEGLSFVPSLPEAKKPRGKAAATATQVGDIDWEPLLLLEFFSFSRVIWDEFPYENIPVTEFVANCATTSKWMLSGTPPLETLGDICKVAYLFNVHVARPLQMIKGRQPPVCEHEPLAPHSDLESTSLFQSRHSPMVLLERHEQSLDFVRVFMRKNDRKTEVCKVDIPLVLAMSPLSLLSYAELQLELRSRQYNANNVGSDARRRLMSRIAWKGKENGRDRSMEALMIRASASSEDVLRQSGLTGRTDLEACKALLAITEKEIQGMEDRGRELFAKAVFLGYRLTFITIPKTTNSQSTQEERQLSYYENLVELVEAILNFDINIFQSWDAFQSAMRMLIWSEGMRTALGAFRHLPRDALPDLLRKIFNGMSICEPPAEQPVWPSGDRFNGNAKEEFLKNLAAQKKYHEIFREWLTKTPLHSRRWYFADKVQDLDPAEEELLRLEWEEKVTWENEYNASEEGGSRVVVPISKLRAPTDISRPDDFDLDHLKDIDACHRTKHAELRNVSAEEVRAIAAELHGYKDTKVFWEEECNRRGLIAKSTDKKDVLIARVAADRANIATDTDYVSPESCGLSPADFPQEGKKRVRGGTMEVIFDQYMQDSDAFSRVLERIVVAHARRNLQNVIADILQGTWVCHKAECRKTYEAHYISLLCGHIFCAQPDHGQRCGVGECQRRVKHVCIPLSKITQPERVIAAECLSGAITEDPSPYLASAPAYELSTKGPKARAVINLIARTKKSDQVVVFVQNMAMEKDIYSELAAAGIDHVDSLKLHRNEAESLEQFKQGKGKVLVQVINSEQAAGSNLHNANHVIFVSPLVSRKQSEWDDHMKQAMGRCVRFRQAKTVYVYHMLMEETIEVDTLEWRMKKEIIVKDGQAAARFNECSTREFLARCDDDSTAPELQLAPEESRAVSILPRDDIQHLMGDDYLSLASIKALRTIDEAIADKGVEQTEKVEMGEVDYLIEPEAYYDGAMDFGGA